MKIMINDYTFNPSLKQIIINDDYVIKLENLLLITNVSSNTIIYNFANQSLGGSVLNNVVTLNYDTITMNSTDKLQIFVDVLDINNNTDDLLRLLKRIVKLIEPLGTVDVNNRQRIAVETMPTVTVASHAVTSAVGFGASVTANIVGGNPYALSAQNMQLVGTLIDQRWELSNMAQCTYNTGIRTKLTFS